MVALVTCDGGIPIDGEASVSLVWIRKKSSVSIIGDDSEARSRRSKATKSKTGVTMLRGITTCIFDLLLVTRSQKASWTLQWLPEGGLLQARTRAYLYMTQSNKAMNLFHLGIKNVSEKIK